MGYIHAHGGTFITVLTRTRGEDEAFRERLLHDVVVWRPVHQKIEKLRNGEERVLDSVQVLDEKGRTKEGYRLLWYHSSLKKELDEQARNHAIRRAVESLEGFQERLQSPRTRLRDRAKVARELEKILESEPGARFVKALVRDRPEERYRQEGPGRPGPTTRYRREVRQRFRLDYEIDRLAVTRESLGDGIFPLVTNRPDWTEAQVYQAYKKQPLVDRRHALLKSGLEVAPVWLKEVARIEALASVFYLALLVCALIERELRKAMRRQKLKSLPLYPEARDCQTPSATRVLDLFDNIQKHTLCNEKGGAKVFRTDLSEAQRQVLRFLGISEEVYSHT
ncbi:MAG: hypothetical protein AB1486_30230 [Planctomycetota bacterium]